MNLDLFLSPRKNKNLGVILDFFSCVIIILVLNKTITPAFDIKESFTSTDGVINHLWISSPLILLYLLMRALRTPSLFALFINVIAILLLNYINITKTALTGEPLSFNDLSSGVNISITAKYINYKSILIALLLGLISAIIFVFGRKIKTTINNYIIIVIALLLITPFTFASYFPVILGDNNSITEKFNALEKKYNVTYLSWDWQKNAIVNGLPMHLIQTSARKSIPTASAIERKEFSNNKIITPAALSKKPKNIIYILCESCWYNNDHFKEYFQPLLNAGFKAFRATSPVYGGGTANAEFEMLTGLPSNSGVLSGIIYQEYASLMKDNSNTLPKMLHDEGYETIAAHNYGGKFWRRDEVYKKFGFDKFLSLSDMGDLPQEYSLQRKFGTWPPDDFLLYRTVLNEIRNNKDKKIFFNLITMSTHGPFQHENDSGEGMYTQKLHESMTRLSWFTSELSKIDPDAIILVYGDHKPALNRFFYENKVFPAGTFMKTGKEDNDFLFKKEATPADYGDVPVFIKSSNEALVNNVILAANGKPFFCVSSIFDNNFIQSGLFSFNYNIEHGCLAQQPYDYKKMTTFTPPWIYALSLFE